MSRHDLREKAVGASLDRKWTEVALEWPTEL